MPFTPKLFDLTGRVSLVTGATGHLGKVICNTLAELGSTVILCDRNAESLREIADSLKDTAGNAEILALDFEDARAMQTTLQSFTCLQSRLDILIHNAAFVGDSNLEGWTVPFLEQSDETWRRCLEVNLTAPFLLTRALTPLLRTSGQGSIIHISSIYGLVGPDNRLYEGTTMGNPAAYSVSKGGLNQFTRWLATTLAPEIRVNTINLGGILRNQPAAFIERYCARTPLRRMGTEEDVQGAIAYLASDLSSYVTGQNLTIDGGWTAW